MRTIRRWLARVPLLLPVAGCLAGIVTAETGAPLFLGGFLSLAMLVAWWSGRRTLAAGFLAFTLFFALHWMRLERQAKAEAWAAFHSGDEMTMEGTVMSLRDKDGFLPRAVLRLTATERGGADLRGAYVAVRGLPDETRPGDRLRLRGRLFVPRAVRNPGEFNRLDWMRTRGLAAEFNSSRIESAGPPSKWMALLRVSWNLRVGLSGRIVAGLDEQSLSAALIKGLVLGDRSGGDSELYNAFRNSGTMHVFAVSGLHVGLVGILAWLLTRLLRVPRSWGLWLVLIAMWSYALITGLRPPALRASLMASVFLIGFAVKRKPSMANGLLASMPVVLLLDSFQLKQAGFQLSYVVVGMIIVAAPFFYRKLHPLVQADPFLPPSLFTTRQRWGLSGREKVLGLLTVSFAAWLGSLPLIATHFGMVTPSAVLASMLLIPLVFVILALAFFGVGLGMISEPVESGVNHVNGILATGAFQVAHGFSELPGSHFEIRHRDAWRDGMVVFDLWSGDAAVYCGTGGGTLIDGGGADEFQRVVRPALRRAGAKVNSLILTHPDGGHTGGMVPALAEYAPRQVLLPVRVASSPRFRELLEVAQARDCKTYFGETGRLYPLGEGVELEILRVAAGTSGRADDRGMVMRLHWDGWRILITGDAGFETEKELLENGVDLRSDLWITGRHASDFTGTIDFVRAVSPRAIVASDAAFPELERIPDWWAGAIDGLGIELWSQRETGAVVIGIEEEKLTLRGFVEPARKSEWLKAGKE